MIVLRRAALVAAAALVLAACTEVKQEPMPQQLVIASFASPDVPTPSDLALAAVPTLGGAALAAQKELLQAFIDAGGFPNDQEVPLNIPIRSQSWDGSKYVVDSTPLCIDPATVNENTLTLLKIGATTATAQPYEFSITSTTGGGAPGSCVITIRNPAGANGRRWEAGARYVFAVRGGPNGVKTSTGKTIAADTAITLVIPNRDLTKRENQPLGSIPDTSNPPNGNADEIAQLEAVRMALWAPVSWHAVDPGTGTKVWAPNAAVPAVSPFDAVKGVWPVAETASIAAFSVAPASGPVVLTDAGSGVAPLPSDLLRTDADGTVVNNPAFGAAAPGLDTLDGFSTTAMILAQTSQPLDASTVNGGNVFLYRITFDAVTGLANGAVMVPELKAVLGSGGNPATAGYVAEPTPIVFPGPSAGCPIAGGCSPAIGLQPAVTAAIPVPPNAAYLPPLRSNTMYAVVVTNRVMSVAGAALTKSTVDKIILDMTAEPATGTPHDTTGVSLLAGVSDETARALRDMRSNLAPVWTAKPGGKGDVVTAYTFKTQSVPDVSLRLAAAPYGIEAGAAQAIFTPSAAPAYTPPPGVPGTGIAGWYDVTFASIDGIDKTTGAFLPTLAEDLSGPGFVNLLAPLRALVAVPDPAFVPNACPGTGGTVKCAPLVIFGHGLNGSRETLLAVASSLAQAGFVAAAIDFPLHGLRNWCSQNSDCDDNGADGVCTEFPGAAGQGDTLPPGTCTTGVTKVFSAPGVNVPSRYFVSANFFRTRDAFRQNVLDESALGLALSRPPAGLAPQPPANPFAAAALGLGVAVDPTHIYYEGISLGSIAGTSVVATNPRISRASLSVGGGTAVDVITNAPAFHSSVQALFASLIPGFSWDKIDSTSPTFDPAIAAQYLQYVNVAKWILDPGDPINYAVYVETAPLPNLLVDQTGATPQAAKPSYGQIAANDPVVPNPFNALLYNLMSADQTLYTGASATHGMLASQAAVQGDAAGFLLGVVPPTTRNLP